MAAARKLAVYVTVDGEQYGPDSEVPAEVAKKIDNPDAWAERPDDEPTSAPVSKSKK